MATSVSVGTILHLAVRYYHSPSVGTSVMETQTNIVEDFTL